MKRMGIMGAGLLLALSVVDGTVWAAKSWSFNEPHDSAPNYTEEAPWQEGSVELPDYPEDDALLEVDLGLPESRFRYYIDPASLSIGEDGVMRYVLVLESRSGSRNLMFEGIRCDQPLYKTYAYGTRKGGFRPLKRPRWRQIGNTASTRYRERLRSLYLCGQGEINRLPTARSVEQILDAIRYSRQGEQSYSR